MWCVCISGEGCCLAGAYAVAPAELKNHISLSKEGQCLTPHARKTAVHSPDPPQRRYRTRMSMTCTTSDAPSPKLRGNDRTRTMMYHAIVVDVVLRPLAYVWGRRTEHTTWSRSIPSHAAYAPPGCSDIVARSSRAPLHHHSHRICGRCRWHHHIELAASRHRF